MIPRSLQLCGEQAQAREWFEKILAQRGAFDDDRDALNYAMALGESEKADGLFSAMLQAFDQLPPYAGRNTCAWINAMKKEMLSKAGMPKDDRGYGWPEGRP